MEDRKIAIITGASSGLGTEYARLLDKEGLTEIWLIARRKDRLEALAETLETKCRCLAVDLTDEKALNALESEVVAAKMVVTYLVNAASKAFLLSYSRALSVELQTTGIQVTAVCPFWIKDTEFVDKAKETDRHKVYRDMPGATNAKHVAKVSLKEAKSGTVVCTPDPVSRMHRIVASLLPHWLLARVCK